MYTITAKGKLEQTGWTEPAPDYLGKIADPEPIFSGLGLRVRCSCPDGDRQWASSEKAGKLRVCKHATAALESVVDAVAVAMAVKTGAARAAKLKKEKVQRAGKLVKERAAQDKALPGERARIEHGLRNLPATEIVAHLQREIESLAGLRNLARIFGSGVMPAKQVLRCLRCDRDYDPHFGTACKIQHPADCCVTRWDGSKISWSECMRCNSTFDLDGVHSWGRNAVGDDGEYCFEGQHTTDAKVMQEDGFDWDADASSYC